jgi:hypothetical protein
MEMHEAALTGEFHFVENVIQLSQNSAEVLIKFPVCLPDGQFMAAGAQRAHCLAEIL